MEITQYVPLLAIHTIGGEIHYIEASKEKAFLDQCAKSKLVKIGKEIVAVHQITRIHPVKDAKYLAHLTTDDRRAIQERIQEFESNLGRSPTENEISLFIKKSLISFTFEI